MKRDLKGSPDKGRKVIEDISAQINQKWGIPMALPLHKAARAQVLKLPTGIFELDWRTGGGIPLCRLTRLWGKPSSLKSTTCLKLTRNAQRFCRHCKLPIVVNPETGERDCACPNPRWTILDPDLFRVLSAEDTRLVHLGCLPRKAKKLKNGLAVFAALGSDGKEIEVQFDQTDRCEPFRCLYIDTEESIDEAWAIKNGVDTSLLMLIGANWAEQVLDLTEELVETKQFDLVILDSLDMLTPADTLEKALSQTKRVASKAGLMTDAVAKWTNAISSGGLLNRYAPTILIVCQVRAHDIGKPWASLKPSGGWAVGHGVSLDVKMEPLKYEYKGDRALFGKFAFHVAKSKVGGFPRSSGEFRYWLRSGKRAIGDTEDMETVVGHAKSMGAVQHKGNKWYLFSKFLKGGERVFPTKKKMLAYLAENSTVYDDLRYALLSWLIREDMEIQMPSQKIKERADREAKRDKMKTVKGKKKGRKKSIESVLDDDDLLDAID